MAVVAGLFVLLFIAFWCWLMADTLGMCAWCGFILPEHDEQCQHKTPGGALPLPTRPRPTGHPLKHN